MHIIIRITVVIIFYIRIVFSATYLNFFRVEILLRFIAFENGRWYGWLSCCVTRLFRFFAWLAIIYRIKRLCILSLFIIQQFSTHIVSFLGLMLQIIITVDRQISLKVLINSFPSIRFQLFYFRLKKLGCGGWINNGVFAAT